jgi:AcrR family transcriptional regulator
MRSVAIAAEISERTIYRYFPSRDELDLAMQPEIQSRVSAAMAEDVAGLEDYAERLFTAFEKHERLARALVTARWVPTTKTRPANLRALRKLIDEAFPRASRAERESATAALRVPLSAAGWAYLKDCGFDLSACIRHMKWLIRTVLAQLEKSKGDRHA